MFCGMLQQKDKCLSCLSKRERIGDGIEGT